MVNKWTMGRHSIFQPTPVDWVDASYPTQSQGKALTTSPIIIHHLIHRF